MVGEGTAREKRDSGQGFTSGWRDNKQNKRRCFWNAGAGRAGIDQLKQDRSRVRWEWLQRAVTLAMECVVVQ